MSYAVAERLEGLFRGGVVPMDVMPRKDSDPHSAESAQKIKDLYGTTLAVLQQRGIDARSVLPKRVMGATVPSAVHAFIDVVSRNNVDYMLMAEVESKDKLVDGTPIKVVGKLSSLPVTGVWPMDLAELSVKEGEVSETTIMGREFGVHPEMNFEKGLGVVGDVVNFFKESAAYSQKK